MPMAIPFIITAIASALTAIGVTGTILGISIATILANVIFSAALIGLSSLLAPTVPPLKAQRAQREFRQALPSRRIYVGRVKSAGPLGFLRVGGDSLWKNVLHSTQLIDAVEKHFLNDKEVTLDGSGWVTEAQYQRRGIKRIRILPHLGADDQVAEPALVATGWGGEYSANHRGRGIYYTTVQQRTVLAEHFQEVYPSGPYDYAAVFRAAKVWDPRDLTQDRETKSTWDWSANAALVILYFLMSDDGARIPWELIEPQIEDWKDQANICDEAVALDAGGSVARYLLCGGWEFTATPRDIVPQMLAAIGGRIIHARDGGPLLRVGVYEAPTFTFDGQHIKGWDIRRGVEKGKLRNVIQASFISPDNNYEETEVDEHRDEASIDIDGEQTAMLDLHWAPNVSQTRRIQKQMAYRHNPEFSGYILTDGMGRLARNKRFIQVTIPSLGLTDHVFEKLTFEQDVASGVCKMEVVSMPSAAFDWDEGTEEGNSPPGTEGPVIEVPDDPTGLEADAEAQLIGADFTGFAIVATIDDPGRDDWKPIFEYQPAGGGQWIEMFREPDTYRGQSGVVPLDNYNIRVRFLGANGQYSGYATDTLTVDGGTASFTFYEGTSSINIPTDALTIKIESDALGGRGGDGYTDGLQYGGGGGGGRGSSVYDAALVAGDWGDAISYDFAAAAGTKLTVDGVINAGTINIDDEHGTDAPNDQSSNPGTGGTAAGGNTSNTNGGDGASGGSGSAGAGGTNGGGAGSVYSSGLPGTAARLVITFTF